jgi:hypothetical protein
MNITVDASEALRKVRQMKMLAKASAYQLTIWGKDALRAVVTASILNTRSGQLMRNVGMLVSPGPPLTATLGTGVGPAKSVVYARIQEEGGVIKPKNAKALTIPLAGVKGRAANYADLFIKKTVTGHVLLCQRNPKRGFRALFLLVPQVTIPARHWFSRPLSAMRPELDRMLSSEELWRVAQALGG